MNHRDEDNTNLMKESGLVSTFICKAFKRLASVLLTLGLIVFGLIFIIAPGLAANLGMFCAGCLAD